MRFLPAIWRESQPGPAKWSNSRPAAMPMTSRIRKMTPGLSMVVISSLMVSAAQVAGRGHHANPRRAGVPVVIAEPTLHLRTLHAPCPPCLTLPTPLLHALPALASRWPEKQLEIFLAVIVGDL